MSDRTITIPLGNQVAFAAPDNSNSELPRLAPPSDVLFQLDESLLHTHMAIFGGTRRGKSKLIEHLCRSFISARRGFVFIDPHSDTADDILAYLASQDEELGIQRANIHYINPNEQLVAIDPFYYDPSFDELSSDPDFAYSKWLHARVLDVERMVTRVLGETEAESKKQTRMHRWMRSVLYAIGIRHDRSGRHFGLREAVILLEPNHPDYDSVTSTVFPLLDTEDGEFVMHDLKEIGTIKDKARREGFTESTLNRLREILSPIIRRILHPRGQRIDFRRIIESNGVVLASLGKKSGMHQIDGHILGGMLIRQIADAVMIAEKQKRNRFYLLIDEAQNFIGEDLEQMFKESGKYKLSLGLAMQSIENLRSGEIDLLETVLGQTDFQVTFQQKFLQNALVLSETLAHRLIDFTPLVHEVQMHAGYEFVLTESRGVSTSVGQSSQQSRSETSGVGFGRIAGTSSSSGRSNTLTRSDFGETTSESNSYSDSVQSSESTSNSFSSTNGETVGTSRSTGTSITVTQTPLAKYEIVEQATGSLARSLDWQDRQIANAFQGLPPQHCFVSIDKLRMGAFMRIVDVIDPFKKRGVSESWKQKVVDGFKQKYIYGRHSYYFNRNDAISAEDDKLIEIASRPSSPFDLD